MPTANIANVSVTPGTDQTGHNQPCLDISYTDAEGLFGDPGTVYVSAMQIFQHGGQKLALSIGNTAEPAKAIFEMNAAAQTVAPGKILIR